MQWNILGRIIYVPKTAVVLLAIAICVVMVVGGYFVLPDAQDTVMVTSATLKNCTTATTAPSQTPGKVVWRIYIVGAVKNPGVYTLEEGALVQDAIAAAGGLLVSVDPEMVNMVQKLQDNVMMKVLTRQECEQQARNSSLILVKDNMEIYGGQSVSESGTTEKININSADKEALMTLPGIGEARAESIIAYREENGPFQTIEDIMLVSGIKQSAFAKIKDSITT